MVGRLLRRLGYRLQSVRKRREGAVQPERNAQFERINATADQFLTAGQPVISVDTKTKELVAALAPKRHAISRGARYSSDR